MNKINYAPLFDILDRVNGENILLGSNIISQDTYIKMKAGQSVELSEMKKIGKALGLEIGSMVKLDVFPIFAEIKRYSSEDAPLALDLLNDIKSIIKHPIIISSVVFTGLLEANVLSTQTTRSKFDFTPDTLEEFFRNLCKRDELNEKLKDKKISRVHLILQDQNIGNKLYFDILEEEQK